MAAVQTSINLSSGVESCSPFTVNFNSAQEAAWLGGNLQVVLPNGQSGYNCLQMNHQGATLSRTATMQLWVWGTQLTSPPARTATLTTNHPAVMTISY